MNKDQLRAKCKKISEETGLNFNIIQTHYFLESILEKISESAENENFIFKGGFLLSNMVGIRQRSTIDIDFLARRFPLTKDNIIQKLEEILLSCNENEIRYSIEKIEEIRKLDEYGGFRIKILCVLDNIKQIIPLDIATGNPITPFEILYEYKSVFENKSFKICTYNIESILAEKIQTIYQLGAFNSRMKDFYDVFVILNLKRKEISLSCLKKACINTFNYRNTNFSETNIILILNALKTEKDILKRWNNYQKNFKYTQEIKFENIINEIITLVEDLMKIS